MPPADTPDFDSMSPEEVMAWMESLAKRQGASEGFLTAADMEIAEIDPSSVEVDEPGYVPFGEEVVKAPSRKEEEKKPDPPAPKTEPTPVIEQLDEPEVSEEDTAIQLDEGSLAWLESLAADQTDGFPEMDLSALSAELADIDEDSIEAEATEVEAPEPAGTNPLNWLESLSEGDLDEEDDEPAMMAAASVPDISDIEAVETADMVEADEPALPDDVDLASITDPLAAGIDPMLWLESLAKRQGAKADEFTTTADMDIPLPEDATDTGPGYQAFSIESDTRRSEQAKPKESLDPAAWLESMASGEDAPVEEADSEMSDEAIQSALASGAEIPPDQMEKFFERQLDRGLVEDEPEIDEDYDPEAPPVPAELPDWLLEQVQPPDESEPVEEAEQQPALVDDFVEPPTQDLPDWLQVDEGEVEDLELENIFETAAEADTADDETAFYSSDPWVQAFSEEAAADPNEIPEWYERNVSDPQRIAAVEQQLGAEADLEAADLPTEETLPRGEIESVPDWAAGAISTVDMGEDIPEGMPDWLSETGAEAVEEEIPDWLAAADVEVEPGEIPDWLRETVETDETEEDVITLPQQTAPEPTPEPEPEPVVTTPVPAQPVAPVAVPRPPADVAAALESARSKASSGDVDGSLLEYEGIIRANASLDQVVSDLTTLADQNRENPAIYRVLGDSLMRQGKLQAALDTYRKALNQL